MSNKTLVIILCETRAFELTYDNFETNVLKHLNADLCINIGVSDNYDYSNPFYTNAKYKFTYKEPEDYAESFNYAYNCMTKEYNRSCDINWREFLKIKNQFLGGILDKDDQHPGSGAILIFNRWLLLQNLKKEDLINKYDRFIITRSDFIYLLPHINPQLLDENYIYIPEGEDYNGGLTDRHVILSNKNVENYLNILDTFFCNGKNYYQKMKDYCDYWNIELLIKFHLTEQGLLDKVKLIPYIMYSVRNEGGSSSWSLGEYNPILGYYIKYHTEAEAAVKNRTLFLSTPDKDIDKFYLNLMSL
jgi:hypothetical protein